MSVQNQLLDIQLMYNQLTKTEKKIADYVLENRSKVLFMSITELADECQVAEASVHRFCRTVGAKGYQEFKMKLSLDSSGSQGDHAADQEIDGDRKSLYSSILKTHLEAIEETNALLDPDVVDRIVEGMSQARAVYFYGVGDSLLTAQEATNKFLRVTQKVHTTSDPHKQAQEASMMGSGDMLFLISYSGASKDNVYVAKIAREAGVKIVVITRFLKSPLTGYADEVLICGSNEGPLEGGSMGSKMSQLHIIDILFQTYYQKTLKMSRANYEKTAKAVVDKLY